MGIKKVFTKGVNVVFKVASDAVHEAIHTIPSDDGWGNTSQATQSVRVILDKFTQEDVEQSSFYDLIQPTDTKGLVPGEDMPIEPTTKDTLTVDGDAVFNIVAWETDPLKAMYTLLLRKT